MALRKRFLRFTGKQVLPPFFEPLFHSCLSPATPQDMALFSHACKKLEAQLERKSSSVYIHALETIVEESEDDIKQEELALPLEMGIEILQVKTRTYKSSINSKKNRANRQATLDGIKKSKKATNLARRRGMVAVTAPAVQQAPVRALIPATSAPIKKKRDSSDTYKLVQPSKLEPALELVRMISILSECALTSITEVDEPIEFNSILKSSKCKILPIMEVEEPIEYEFKCTLSKFKLIPIFEEEEPEEEVDTSDDTSTDEDDSSEAGQILPVEQEPEVEAITFDENDEDFLWDDEFSQPHSSQPRQLEQEAEAEDNIDFGHVDEPLDIPEATPEPIESPKKLRCRRCKAVESSLDGRYWSVSSRRRRKSSRVRRQPDFFTPS